jgi:hypothetical protein
MEKKFSIVEAAKNVGRKVKNHVREHWFEDLLLLVGTGASVYTATKCIKEGSTVTINQCSDDSDGDDLDVPVEEETTITD